MFFGHNLARSVNFALLSDGVSAGSGDTQTSTVLDMVEDRGACFILTLGTVASGGGGVFKLQSSMDNGVSDPFTDIAGSSGGFSFTSTNSGHALVIDVYRPQKRYLQAVVVRGSGGNTTIQSIVAVTYHLSAAPETPGTSVDNVVWLSNPGPGTA